MDQADLSLEISPNTQELRALAQEQGLSKIRRITSRSQYTSCIDMLYLKPKKQNVTRNVPFLIHLSLEKLFLIEYTRKRTLT